MPRKPSLTLRDFKQIANAISLYDPDGKIHKARQKWIRIKAKMDKAQAALDKMKEELIKAEQEFSSSFCKKVKR